MGLLTNLSRFFRTAPAPSSSPPPLSTATPAPVDADAEVAILTAAHRKATLKRMQDAIFYDANREEFGVRLPDGRTLYRPSHHEAIALWYAEDNTQPVCTSRKDNSTPAGTMAPPARNGAPQGPRKCRHRRLIEAVTPATGEVCRHSPSVTSAHAAGFDCKAIGEVLAGRRKTHRSLVRRDVSASPPRPARASSNDRIASADAWALVARLPQLPVESYELVTGKVQTVYSDPCAVLGAGLRDALPVLNGQGQQAYSLGWRFQQQGKVKGGVLPARRGRCRPVFGRNPNTGRIEVRYGQVTHAIRAGCTINKLYGALKYGRLYEGLLWFYEDETSIEMSKEQECPKL